MVLEIKQALRLVWEQGEILKGQMVWGHTFEGVFLKTPFYSLFKKFLGG